MNSPHGVKKILVIEDDRAIRRAVEFRLTKAGYAVLTAVTGEEGLRLASSEMPDLILLDVVLPRVDGFGVLDSLKSNEKIKQVPVIVFSNYSQDTDKEKAKRIGATDFFVKSEFSIENVVTEVEKYVR